MAVVEIHQFPPMGLEGAVDAVASPVSLEEIRTSPPSTEARYPLHPAYHELRLPESFRLGTVGDGRLRVREPFSVTCRTEDDHIVMEATEIEEFGFGGNCCDALRDLQATIVELFFTLERESERLGPDLQRIRTILHKKLLRQP